MKKLIFLHIDKAAGTSQRALFYESFGKEKVYWYGIDSESKAFYLDDMRESLLIGGHRQFDFYMSDEYGYLAVVREPIERVISLFNYYRKPDQVETWRRQFNLDPESLKNTLRDSKAFRDVIKNAQCRYLSGSESFDKAKENISKNKFVVASLDNVDSFNDYLIEKIDCINGQLSKHNVGKAGYRQSIEVDDELKTEITKLVSEDIKLYSFINNDCNGLFDNIKASDWAAFNAIVEKGTVSPDIRLLIKKLSLEGGALSAQVELHNETDNDYSPDNCYVGLRLFDAEGKSFLERRHLIEPISSHSRKTFMFRAEGIEQGWFNAKFSIIDVNNKRWLDDTEVSTSEFQFQNR